MSGWGCPECGHAKAGHDERGCPACECSYPFAAVAARPVGEDQHEWECDSCPNDPRRAPSSPVTDQSREEIARAIFAQQPVTDGLLWHECEDIADAVLATPTLRRLLDTTASPAIRPVRPGPVTG